MFVLLWMVILPSQASALFLPKTIGEKQASGQKTASGIFSQPTLGSTWLKSSQVVDLHQKKQAYGYDVAVGYPEARYYNPLTRRFLNVDPALEGWRGSRGRYRPRSSGATPGTREPRRGAPD